MVFSSIPFLFYFLPVCLILYYIVPFSFKNGVLLIFSLIFYAWGEPVYIILLVVETLFDFINGLCMEKFGTTQRKRIFSLCCSIVMELLVLFYFKYSGFLIDTFNSVFATEFRNPQIALPLGISFFTFQTMSYMIDLYRNEIKAEHNYFNYLTYVSMFPQLIAGPIVRYSTVQAELHERKILWEEVQHGTLRFMRGLFKKTLIANEIGLLWSEISTTDMQQLSVVTAWTGAIAVTLQIYFDFSGYSDMAIGIGEMLGFHFNENFKHPLSAVSITDFWRRWHMSLSQWFRDYVYIPLGGNRVIKWKKYRNILIVWMLTGLWHGASWNFVCWGLYYGVLLICEKLFLSKILQKVPKWLQHIYTILIVSFGFVIFSLEDFLELVNYISAMLGGTGILVSSDIIWYLQNYGIILTVACIFSFPVLSYMRDKMKWRGKNILVGLEYIVLFILSVSSIVNDSYNPFLYFRF